MVNCGSFGENQALLQCLTRPLLTTFLLRQLLPLHLPTRVVFMFDSKLSELRAVAHTHRSSRRHRTAGFSLIELMISLTIGLVIAIAAMSAYLGSATASKMSDAQSRMNEDAQAALNLIVQQLRLAGANPVQANRADTFRHNPVFDPTYVGGTSTVYGTTTLAGLGITVVPGTYTMSAFPIRGCDGTFSNITSAANLSSLTCAGTTTTLPDSLAVSYEADKFNTIATSAGLATDCVGGALSATSATFPSGGSTTATWAVADNRFYVKSSSSGIPSLYCKGAASSEQPLVENVEDMQLNYGVVSTSNTTSTATVAGYLAASDVVTDSTMALLTSDADRWGRVLSVRVCVVVRSESAIAPDTGSSSYTKCDGSTDSSKTDMRLRRAYSTTVVLRNRRF
jgi:type IV pilus assembly protein PilW